MRAIRETPTAIPRLAPSALTPASHAGAPLTRGIAS
ncbi:hypothetical protein E143388_08245 [Rhodococcus opacus]|nr:hypothetical protein E143388_08245 [Rhodococcus opacus]